MRYESYDLPNDGNLVPLLREAAKHGVNERSDAGDFSSWDWIGRLYADYPEWRDRVDDAFATLLTAEDPLPKRVLDQLVRAAATKKDPWPEYAARLRVSESSDPRMNGPVGLGLGLGPRVDLTPPKPPNIALLKEQLTHKYYQLRFGAWDGLVAAFGIESVVRAPRGREGKGTTGLPRRWAEASLAFGVEKNDERVLNALVRLDATWTVPILQEASKSPSVTYDFREKLKYAIRELTLA